MFQCPNCNSHLGIRTGADLTVLQPMELHIRSTHVVRVGEPLQAVTFWKMLRIGQRLRFRRSHDLKCKCGRITEFRVDARKRH